MERRGCEWSSNPIQNANRQHPVLETSEANVTEDDVEDWEIIVTERPHRGGSSRIHRRN
jgi:hypothetical protein